MNLETYYESVYKHYYSTLSPSTVNYMMLDTDIMRRNIRKLEREVLKAGS